MTTQGPLIILTNTDSTNNYAMQMVQEGIAQHGMAWFAHSQSSGKGSQGKNWESPAGESVALTIVLQPGAIFQGNLFHFNALISLTCIQFFSELAGNDCKIKWPNDIYWRDRKAGGILIENKFQGQHWVWAIVGIGLNINQTHFNPHLPNPVSVFQITNKKHDPLTSAAELHKRICFAVDGFSQLKKDGLFNDYNDWLYKKECTVFLRKENQVFETKIVKVNEQGLLICNDVLERAFKFGEVEWIIESED